nr:hypothetical protein [Tanacetum cinerariifolium]
MMSTLVFVDPKSSTHANRAQRSRVPVSLPEDPYEAIRHAYLVGTDTESKPFKGKYETPGSSDIVAPPTCHVEESEGSDTSGSHDEEARSSRSKRPRQHETVEEVLLLQVHHEFTMSSCYGKDVVEMLSLGLYQVTELEEECFNVYFEGGLRSDEHFNTQDYWLSISREEHLGLSRSHTSTIRNPILRTIHKMITYGLCQRTTMYDKIQKNDLWLLSMFDARLQNGYANVAWPGIPRVGIPRPPRASIQDLYDRMGRMEIRQEAIEYMEYRQSYHWIGIFSHYKFKAVETYQDSTTPLSPDHPLTHTAPAMVPIRRRTVRMAVRVPPTMSHDLSSSIAEVATMSDLAFRKSEEDGEVEKSLKSDSESEDAEDEGPTVEDEDPAAGDGGLGVGVEGPGMDDESYGFDDESYDLDDESHGLDDEGHDVESDGLGLEEEEEAVPGGQQHVALVVGTVVSVHLRLGYGALRRRELALEEDHVYSTFEVGQGSRSAPESERPERVSASRQPTLTTWTDPEDSMVYIDVPACPPPAPPVQTPPSPEWTSGSLPISPSPFVVPSPVSSPMIPLIVPSPIASPVATSTATIPVNEDQFIEVGAQLELYRSILQDHTQRLDAMPPTLFVEIDRDVRELYTRLRAVRDDIFSQRYRFRSMEHKQERTAMTFKALWRLVLALEAWAGRVDTRMTDMPWAGYDDHRLVHDMLLLQTALQRELHEMRGRVTALK